MPHIALSNSHGRCWTVVSQEDYEFLSQWKWGLTRDGYAARVSLTGGKKKYISMHRLIAERMGIGGSVCIDHRDGDRLDNRRESLRPASKQQNGANRRHNKNNLLGVKGVSQTVNGTFEARITVFGKKHYLGTYKRVEDAKAAYAKAANQHFGEFALT